MSDEAKVTRIEIQYSDGTVKWAEGEHADQIMRWWTSCEVMNCIHWAQYSGKPLNGPIQKAQG